MHRMKIGLVAAAVLLALTGGLYSVVTKELKDTVVQEVETEVSRAQRMHQSIARLESLDFANLVAGLSHRPGVDRRRVRQDRRDRAPAGGLRAVRGAERLPAEGGSRKADIVAILDSAGKVVARDLNVNAMYGEDLRAEVSRPSRRAARRGDQGHLDLLGAHDARRRGPHRHPDGTIRRARCWSATS